MPLAVTYIIATGRVLACKNLKRTFLSLFIFLASQRCSQEWSTSLFAFINRKRSANFLPVPFWSRSILVAILAKSTGYKVNDTDKDACLQISDVS